MDKEKNYNGMLHKKSDLPYGQNEIGDTYTVNDHIYVWRENRWLCIDEEVKLENGIRRLKNSFRAYSYLDEETQELYLHPRTGLCIDIFGVENYDQLVWKVIAYCSEATCIATPFYSDTANRFYQDTIRNKLNKALDVKWSREKWQDLYSRYGNGINKEECLKLIKLQKLFPETEEEGKNE